MDDTAAAPAADLLIHQLQETIALRDKEHARKAAADAALIAELRAKAEEDKAYLHSIEDIATEKIQRIAELEARIRADAVRNTMVMEDDDSSLGSTDDECDCESARAGHGHSSRCAYILSIGRHDGD